MWISKGVNMQLDFELSVSLSTAIEEKSMVLRKVVHSTEYRTGSCMYAQSKALARTYTAHAERGVCVYASSGSISTSGGSPMHASADHVCTFGRAKAHGV